MVYKRKRSGFGLTPYETLTSGFSAPMGMVATPDGRWYIANSRIQTSWFIARRVRDPRDLRPARVPEKFRSTSTLPPNRQLVAVSNGSTTGSGAGSVSVYLNRQDRPSRILTLETIPSGARASQLTRAATVTGTLNDPRKLTGSIVKLASCNGSGTLSRSGILRAGGLAFDHSGNLYYVDQLLGIFKCYGWSYGLLAPMGVGGLIIPRNINFDNGSPQSLWVADAAGYIDAVSLQA